MPATPTPWRSCRWEAVGGWGNGRKHPSHAVVALQLYLSFSNASVPVPARALVAFARVAVPARGSASVTLRVPPRVNAVMRAGDLVEEIQPGRRTLWLGGCSDPARLPGVALAFTTVGAPTPLSECPAGSRGGREEPLRAGDAAVVHTRVGGV